MSEIGDALEAEARPLLSDAKVPHKWTGHGTETLRLLFPKQNETGFDVEIVARPWGLELEAGAWHTGPWEPSERGLSTKAACQECLGFARTLLSSDAYLEVHYSGQQAYKWTMHYAVEGGREHETTGLLLFNYFGKRGLVRLQNTTLPPRYGVV